MRVRPRPGKNVFCTPAASAPPQCARHTRCFVSQAGDLGKLWVVEESLHRLQLITTRRSTPALSPAKLILATIPQYQGKFLNAGFKSAGCAMHWFPLNNCGQYNFGTHIDPSSL